MGNGSVSALIVPSSSVFVKKSNGPRISELPVVFKTKQHNKISISLLHSLYYLTSKISENVSRYPPEISKNMISGGVSRGKPADTLNIVVKSVEKFLEVPEKKIPLKIGGFEK